MCIGAHLGHSPRPFCPSNHLQVSETLGVEQASDAYDHVVLYGQPESDPCDPHLQPAT